MESPSDPLDDAVDVDDTAERPNSAFKPPPPRAQLHFTFAPISKNARFASATLSRKGAAVPSTKDPAAAKEQGMSPSRTTVESPPRSFGARSRVETSRAKVEEERIAAALAVKEERLKREAQQQEQQQSWCDALHEAATKSRASVTAAREEKQERDAQRRRETEAVRHMGAELRRQRARQRASHKALGHRVQQLCLEARAAAKSARERMGEERSAKAKEWAKERSEWATHCSEAKASLETAKRTVVKHRRAAEASVGQDAVMAVVSERAEAAAIIRKQLENDTLKERERLKAEIEARHEEAGTGGNSGAHQASHQQYKKRHERSTFSRVTRQTKDLEAHALWASSAAAITAQTSRVETLDVSAQRAQMAQETRYETRKLQLLVQNRREEEMATRRNMRDGVVQQLFSVDADVLVDRRRANDAHSDTAPLQSSAGLVVEAQSLRQRASEAILQVQHVSKMSFTRRLAAAVAAKTAGKSLNTLVREWDRNEDGELSPLELRSIVRGNLGVRAENKEIDAFFATLDGDGSGMLDLDELKSALKLLKDETTNYDSEIVELREEAEVLRQQATVIERVAQSIGAFNKADALMKEHDKKITVAEAEGEWTPEQCKRANLRKHQLASQRLTLRRTAVHQQNNLCQARLLWTAEIEAKTAARAKAAQEALNASKEKAVAEEEKQASMLRFQALLGDAIIEKTKGRTLADVMAKWDPNGDGQVNLSEFRSVVRYSLEVTADDKAIDEFFASMDSDRGNSLDLTELRKALKVLKEASSRASHRPAKDYDA